MGDVVTWILVASAAMLIVATAITVRLPPGFISPSTAVSKPGKSPIPSLDSHLARWSQLHGGLDPSSNVVVRRWLTMIHQLARIPARWGVSPNVLSCWGIWLAGACAVTAVVGGRWPLLGAVLVAANGLADGLDGAVAVLSGKVGRYGKLIDAVADRASDALLLVALVALGAAGWLGLAAGVGIYSLEMTRALGLRAGRRGRLTPGERPTRLILAGLGLVGAGVWPMQGHVMGAIALEATALVAWISWALLAYDLRVRPGR